MYFFLSRGSSAAAAEAASAELRGEASSMVGSSVARGVCTHDRRITIVHILRVLFCCITIYTHVARYIYIYSPYPLYMYIYYIHICAIYIMIYIILYIHTGIYVHSSIVYAAAMA